jgi:hypothetical protein
MPPHPLALRRLLSRPVAPTRARRSPGQPRRRPGPALLLEALEDRSLPTVTFRGGALLANVEAQGVYLGNQWQNDSTASAQAGYLEGYLSSIVNSSYMDALSNAGYNVGRGSSSDGWVNPVALTSGSTLDDSTIRADLNAGISAGTLATPDANRLYVVFVEPNIVVQQGGSTSRSFRGYHTAYTGPGGNPVRYAVIAYPRGTVHNASVSFLADIDSMTKTASHEIAEAATDPDVNYRTLAWYDSTQGGEIGDINNDRVVTLNGYVVQRVIDKTDHNMTPAGATANAAMSFVLTGNGQLYKAAGGTLTLLASGIQSVSDQSIDNQGHVMVDVVTTGGAAREYHDGAGFTTVRSGAAAAVSGQGVSFVLTTGGSVYEYDDSNGQSTLVGNNAAAINAGTDKVGVDTVGILSSDGTAQTHSDASGSHTIASNVASLSVGEQGFVSYLSADGSAYLFSEATGATTSLDSGVSQVTLGTDETGAYLIELLYADGTAQEYRASTGTWSAVWSDPSTDTVSALSKARLGLVDVVFGSGDAYEHTADGFTTLLNSGTTAAAV